MQNYLKFYSLISSVLFILIFGSCDRSKDDDAQDKTILEGTISQNYKDKTLFLKYINDGNLVTSSKTPSENGKFEFELDSISEYPLLATLSFDTVNYAPKVPLKNQFLGFARFKFGTSNPAEHGHATDRKIFIISKGKNQIEIEDSLKTSKVSSKINAELDTLYHQINVNKDSSLYATKRFVETMDLKYSEKNSKFSKQIDEYIAGFIKDHSNSFSSVFALYTKPYLQVSDTSLVKAIDPKLRNHSLIKDHLTDIQKKVNSVEAGDTISNFSLKDQNGKTIEFKDIKAKYVLVDFWASWCAPCRKANKEIVKFYSDYSREDFEIISVSVDSDEEKWKKAIAQDKINWIHLLDENDKVNNKFTVFGYPTAFLLDPDRVVLDKKIDPEELKMKLDELLN